MPKSLSSSRRICRRRKFVLLVALAAPACLCLWTARWAARADTTHTVMTTTGGGAGNDQIFSRNPDRLFNYSLGPSFKGSANPRYKLLDRYHRESGTVTASNPVNAVTFATLVVNTTADTDDGVCNAANCTLREAINAANANSNADIITFSVSGTITLGSTLPRIYENLTIDGSGQNIILDGAHQHAIIYADNGALTGADTEAELQLSLIHLTITNGASNICTATTCDGGGVWSAGGILKITDCTFTNNSAANSGGAIAANGDDLTITNSTFSNNTAQLGGAVCLGICAALPQTLPAGGSITGSTFSGNTAANYGGGIYCTGDLTVQGSSFSSNQSGGSGAGIYSEGSFNIFGSLKVSSSSFSNNSTFGNLNPSSGGGISVSGIPVEIQNCSFSGNTSVNTGGGINQGGGGTLLVTDSTFTNNGSGLGGGISNLSKTTVIGSTFSGNYSSAGGGGAISSGQALHSATLNVVNSTFSANNSSGAQGASGGAIFNFSDVANITNSTFIGNTAFSFSNFASGGAIVTLRGFFGNKPIMSVTNSSFSSNYTFSFNSTADGGAITNSGCTLNVTNSTLSNNATLLSGVTGGIYNNDRNGTLALRNTIIANNTGDCVSTSGTVSGANNLIMDSATACGLTNGVNGNLIGFDPVLAPLASNGGPTQTFRLGLDSPAIDAGADVTTLNGAIDNAVTSIAVADATAFTAGVGFAIQIDSEQMIVTAKTANTLTVTRGANSTAAAHSDGAAVNPAFDQRGTGFPRRADSADANSTATLDIGAFELHPAIENITDKSTNEDTPFNFNFNIGDGTGSLIQSVTATSNKQTLAPNGNLVITGSGSTRTLAITPAANANGTATITVTVTATNGQKAQDTFLLTVNAVNDAPTFQITANPPTVNDTAGPQTVNGLAVNFQPGPATATDEAGQTLVGYTLTPAGSTGSLMFSSGPAIDNTGTLTYTPTAGTNGTASFNVVAIDSGSGLPPNVNQSAPLQFIIRVNPFLIGSFNALQVNTTADTDDGSCDPLGMGGGNHDCTLREAITLANADDGPETITFNPTVFASPGPYTISLLSALPNITSDINIQGPGAKVLSVERNSGAATRFRIFTNAIGTVEISGLMITKGFTADGPSGGDGASGGGIFNDGTLTLSSIALSGNQTGKGGDRNGGNGGSGGPGGGIHNLGALTISNSTISGNTAGNGGDVTGGGLNGAGGAGGGIANSGSLTLSNTTISGNTAGVQGSGGSSNIDGPGGGIVNGGPLTISNSTITNNSAGAGSGSGGGIRTSGGTLTLQSTIVANNSAAAAPDIDGDVQSDGFNLIRDITGANINQNMGAGPDITGQDPLLNPLADNGGQTMTHSLQCSSPAIEKGNAFGLTTDQRGVSRPIDLLDANAIGGDGSDIGAFEFNPGSLIVTNANDSGLGSLRQAILDACNGATITFDMNQVVSPIVLTSDELLINKSLTIQGPGANLLTVQRSSVVLTPAFRVFETGGSNITVNISGLTISNGRTADGAAGNDGVAGAGILNNANVTLSLNGVVISDNRAGTAGSGGGHFGGAGGGIANLGTLTIANSTISANQSGQGPNANDTGGFGGGIANFGLLTLVNSTVSGNQTGTGSNGGAGGGVANVSAPASLTVVNSTITNNQTSGGNGGGIFNSGIAPSLRNTIIGGNVLANGGQGPELFGNYNSQDFNLIGDVSGTTITGATTHNLTNQDAKLGPLANNGGPTPTHSLLAGSPALDAGDNCVTDSGHCSDSSFSQLTTDQRGEVRKIDGPDADTAATTDIGAFEAQVSVEDIPNQTTNEDTQLQFTFNLGGAGSITSVTAASGNPTLVPNDAGHISLSGSDSTRTLTIDPVTNLSGASTITITVNGNNGESMTDTFLLTVNPLADTPFVTNVTTPEETQTEPIFIAKNPNDGVEVAYLKVTGITNGLLFLSDGNTPVLNNSFLQFSDVSAGLKFTPATDLNTPGSTFSFTIQAATGNTDAALGGNPATSIITVTPVNDPPSFTKGPDQTLPVNAGAQTIVNWATNLSVGPANETGQTLSFNVTVNTNTALFSSQPAISSTGTLTFTPAANASGSATVTIALSDTGGTADGGVDTSAPQSFVISVNCGPTVVTSSNDSGAGSLRDIILHACDGATITFDMTPGNVTNPITLTGGELVIDKNLTIQGPGANLLMISGNDSSGIFNIGSTFTAALSRLTMSHGRVNTSLSEGGAIHNNGTLTITGSTISGNVVDGSTNNFGGGISNGNSGNLTLRESTVAGNSATGGSANNDGGGIFNSGVLSVINSTISGNSANSGGGLSSSGTLTIINSTISGNSGSAVAGGIYVTGGTASVRNTIVTGNTSPVSPDVRNAFVSQGNNLIGASDGSTGFTDGVNNDRVGTVAAPLNALLAPLANYGGPTQTIALLPGSPAIDAANNCVTDVTHCGDASVPQLTTDQRALARQVGSAVDIGAFESRGFTISATSGTPQSATILDAFGAPLIASVTGIGGEPVNGGIITFTAPAANASAVLTGGGSIGNVTIAGGQASINATANATAGSYNVSAGAVGATPASFSLTNNRANTSTAVSSSVNPSGFGQSVTFTATVTSGAGTPSGTIQFKDNGANIGAAVAFTSGVAQFSTSTLTAGTHTVTADYSGSGNFNISTGTLSGGQVVGAQPSLSIDDLSITEGQAGTKVLSFTVTLSAASSLTVTANYATADGTATAPADYVATNGPLTFNPNETSKTISVTVNGDVSFEPDETLTVTLSNAANATISKAVGAGTIKNDDVQGGFISFSAANTSVNEIDGNVTITVVRTNDVTQAVTVDYATDDTGSPTDCGALNTGLASQRCDYTLILGTLRFAPNETQKTVDIPINLDGYPEGPETFTVKLTNPTGGAVLVTPSTATVTINDSTSPLPNPVDDTASFVRQQYHDFLNRDADPAGLAFWTDNIDKCTDVARLPRGQTILQCLEIQRIHTTAAFFLSIEFQQTGNFVRSLYVAALDRPLTNNMEAFIEFERDTQAVQRGVIVGQVNWQQTLDNNRDAFIRDFVTRPEFVGLYPTTDTPTQYVDKLYLHANVTPGSAQERNNAIAEFGGAATTSEAGARGRALLRITQNAAFQARELNRAFVQMEYFGYLRRNPNDAPDGNFNGYNFWVNKLTEFNGDFLKAEMVKAFLTSTEYRQRFGP